MSQIPLRVDRGNQRVTLAEFCFLADIGSNPGMAFNVDEFAYRPIAGIPVTLGKH